MPSGCKPALGESPLPALAGADRGRVVEQAVFLLLLRQPGELVCERMPGREERFHNRINQEGVYCSKELVFFGSDREANAEPRRRTQSH